MRKKYSKATTLFLIWLCFKYLLYKLFVKSGHHEYVKEQVSKAINSLHNKTKSTNHGNTQGITPKSSNSPLSSSNSSTFTHFSSSHSNADIFFLKTHKTASSCIQNILYRYADEHGHQIVFPKEHHQNFWYPTGFNKSMILQNPETVLKITGQKKSVVCNHLRFTSDVWKVLNKTSTFAFSIIREPVSLFYSTFAYFKEDVAAFLKPNTPKEFFDNVGEYFVRGIDGFEEYNKTEKARLKELRGKTSLWWLARNHQMFDFGFDAELENSDEIYEAIEKIERNYDVILIMEYMLESLLILKDRLGWKSLDDIAFIVMNANRSHKKRVKDTAVEEKIRSWNRADTLLYHHFNQTFFRYIKHNYGSARMESDKLKLEKRLMEIRRFCINSRTETLAERKSIKAGQKVWNPKGADIVGYEMSKYGSEYDICRNLVRPELPYAQKLKLKQGHVKEYLPIYCVKDKSNFTVREVLQNLNLESEDLPVLPVPIVTEEYLKTLDDNYLKYD